MRILKYALIVLALPIGVGCKNSKKASSDKPETAQEVRIDEASYERLFFEWGHPAVRDFCQQRGLRYPALNEEGEIDDPSAWYARVRAGTAELWEKS